jgi:hypothetical protein
LGIESSPVGYALHTLYYSRIFVLPIYANAHKANWNSVFSFCFQEIPAIFNTV